MGVFKASQVTPNDEESTSDERRSASSWVKRHPVAAAVLITLGILAVCAAIVVPVVCTVHGCPPKKEEPYEDPLYKGAPNRLIVSFLSDLDVADLVPPLLQQYTARVRMELSNLQIIEAVDKDVLDMVESAVRERTGIDLEFLVRDFVLRAPPDYTVLEGFVRRRAQATPNDPGLAQAWWWNRINVTAAWQLLGLNSSNANTQTSDVIIAVTDSGAQVDHPDLLGSWWVNPDEVDDDRTDNDNNAFIDDVHGACFSTRQCSPYYAASFNMSNCGIGRNTLSWNNITDKTTHGTKIAGIIAAAANNAQGLAGVAPNLRTMILKVTDESFDPFSPPYAYSDVVRAIDYGYGKGARIFSMSFGNDARNGMTIQNKASLDAAGNSYRTLFRKYNNALFVAAAGNEWTNLDRWRSANYTYSPCMVGSENVLCVGATDSSDKIFYMWIAGRDQGTNWGATTVDMGAPGADIYTTTVGNAYTSVFGTSFAAPMTAAVAGLVLAALGGPGRATADTPTQLKNILTSSGDAHSGVNGAVFKSMRRLNAGRAVEAALVLARTNRTTVRRFRSFEALASSWRSMAFEYTFWINTRNDAVLEPFDMPFLDYFARLPPNANQQSIFNIWRYSTMTFCRIEALLRIESAGLYSVMMMSRGITADKWQLHIGENVMVWRTNSSANFQTTNAVNFTSDLNFPEPGWYKLSLSMYPNFNADLRIVWTTPTNSRWAYPPNLYWTVNDGQPVTRHYDPNASPKPALWHVVWNETTNWTPFNTDNRQYFHNNQDPKAYVDGQATVSDFSWATATDMRTTLFGTAAAAPPIIYGFARANLLPANYSQSMAFRMQGPHTRLFINGRSVFDFQSDTQLMAVSPCVFLQSNVAHEIYFYFAIRTNISNPLGIAWGPCTAPANPPGGLSGVYTSMTPSLGTNFWWQPSSIASLPRGIRCDAWPAAMSAITIGSTPVFNTTPPVLSWIYPRDCHPSWRVGTECRMATRLSEMFPALTWNTWTARCWTYWSSSFTNGTTRAANLAGAAYTHMAGKQVYEQNGDGVSYTLYAPRRTNFAVADAARRTNGVYQLLVMEWVAFGGFWNLVSRLQTMNGNLMVNVTDAMLATDSARMVLPASALVPLTWRDVTSL